MLLKGFFLRVVKSRDCVVELNELNDCDSKVENTLGKGEHTAKSFPKQALVFMYLQYKSFENTGKRRNCS